MAARIFITGGNGLLGSSIRDLLDTQKIEYTAPLTNFDITKSVDVHNALIAVDDRYDVVIHCAAVVDVDYAETVPGHTYDVNTKGTALLAEACRTTGTPMVFMSSDYVFAGKRTEISEWDEKNPVNVYGMSKACAEDIVQYFLPGKHAILRTAGLYGLANKGYVNFVLRSMLNGAKDGKHYGFLAPTHRTFQPTSAHDLAIMVMETASYLRLSLLDGGIYHATCSGAATHQDVARLVAMYLNEKVPDLGHITVSRDTDWLDPTPRPAASLLGKSAWAGTTVNELGPWNRALWEDLPDMVSNLMGNTNDS